MKFSVSNAWRESYPEASIGVIVVRNVINPATDAGLEIRKTELEAVLRSRFSGLDRSELEATPPLPAYKAYYRRFKKTYHVFLQLESVALKGKSIPSAACLVEAMFMAELENMLLTAGHDLDAVHGSVYLDIADGTEHYTRLNGQDQILKPGDMYIADSEGVISNIIYGPDQRTQINPNTNSALFTTYGPPGVGTQAIDLHLRAIFDNIKIFAPGALIESLLVIAA